MLLVDVLLNKLKKARTPVWFMRQAGRYLPEYQVVRKKYANFLEFTRSPQDAALVTLQPTQRYDLDAAIIFSDILVVPAALGQKVDFVIGEGPKLEPWDLNKKLDFTNYRSILQPTLTALEITRQQLDQEKALIGFAGAPWTLACYMLTGQGSKDYQPTITAAYKQNHLFQLLLDQLVDATIQYLSWQIEAGANVIQLFDSWASLCPEPLFEQAVVNPLKTICTQMKKLYPHIPLIVFAKGVGVRLKYIIDIVGADGIGIDQMQPLESLNEHSSIVYQGGLDPYLLYAGGDLLKSEVFRYLNHFKNQPYIFNLGHGIFKKTPPEHVQQVVQWVREWDSQNA